MYDYDVLITLKDQNLFHHATNIRNSDDLTNAVLGRVGRAEQSDSLRVDILLPMFKEYATLDSSVFANCMGNYMTVRVVEKKSNELVSVQTTTTEPLTSKIVLNRERPKIITLASPSSESDEFEDTPGKSKRKPKAQAHEEPPQKRAKRVIFHNDRKLVTFSTSKQSFEDKEITDVTDQMCSDCNFAVTVYPIGRKDSNSTNVGMYLRSRSAKENSIHADCKLWVLYPSNKHKLLIFHKHLHLKSTGRYGGNASLKFEDIDEFVDDGQINWCAEISHVKVANDANASCKCTPIKCCCGSAKTLLKS